MKKRILYIGNNLSNSTFTATYISFFSQILKKEGYWVKTASDKDNKAERLVDMLYLIWKNRKETDLVLIDTYGAQNFYYAFSIAKLCQKLELPYVPILHGGNLPGRLESSKQLCRSTFGKAFMNVAPSHFLYDIFKAEGFDNVKIIPNSIVLSDYPFKQREVFKPKLLWVRRFQERYNPMLALEVYRELLQTYPDAELCMVGPEKDGSLSKCKKYAQKHNLTIRFSGKLEKKDWAEISRDYDYFINTTNIDNTPISVMEAMALGLPVVSTDVGGMPFLIEHGKDGVLVPEKDRESMTRALIELIEDQEKSKSLAVEANLKVQDFDWEVVREKWIEVLDRR